MSAAPLKTKTLKVGQSQFDFDSLDFDWRLSRQVKLTFKISSQGRILKNEVEETSSNNAFLKLAASFSETVKMQKQLSFDAEKSKDLS